MPITVINFTRTVDLNMKIRVLYGSTDYALTDTWEAMAAIGIRKNSPSLSTSIALPFPTVPETGVILVID